ncbi:TIGR00269 family protein, partial [Candidatus Woesearchaeota archaeon]|nr:TIGR00269 family protein [Candidatus Woesearchaeota archaeon]
ANLGYRNSVRDMLNDFEAKYPGTKHSIVDSFIQIIPMLKESFKEVKTLNTCKICQEPTSKEICQACSYKEELN